MFNVLLEHEKFCFRVPLPFPVLREYLGRALEKDVLILSRNMILS